LSRLIGSNGGNEPFKEKAQRNNRGWLGVL